MPTPSVSIIPESVTRDLQLKGFRIHALPGISNVSIAHGRRDFYKVGLITGNMAVVYGDDLLEINGTVLFFVNPNIAHSIVRNSEKTKGYACLFTEAFIAGRERKDILQFSPLFRSDMAPLIRLNKEQASFMTALFEKMLSVHSSDYPHKDELLKSCIELVTHEALRIQPSQNEPQHKDAAARITYSFLELLERQFPIDNLEQPLRLRTAQDFASSLAVHINYLNRSVKKVTGKPTTVHLAERIAAEAKALLLYTDWSISDIAYGLGFAYPTYFNNYFKRVTGRTPNSFRKTMV
jgi:AraC-like DNA-binding protein